MDLRSNERILNTGVGDGGNETAKAFLCWSKGHAVDKVSGPVLGRAVNLKCSPLRLISIDARLSTIQLYS